MLHLDNLRVEIDDKTILHNIDLNIEKGRTHVIMGPNGSGKSTLAHTLAGNPMYHITDGTILLNKQNITDVSPDKRAQVGFFLAFQNPPAIPGVNVFTFLKEAYQALTAELSSINDFQQLIHMLMEQLHIDSSFIHRSLNDGFSGGERKKFEMLQLLLLQPKIAILDEIDSGLDIDALKIVARGIEYARNDNPDLSVLLITHYQRILDHIYPDKVHILSNGTIIKSGTAQLAQQLEQKGYDAFTNAQ